MRINTIRVDRYGPMKPFAKYQLGNFTLVHGPNEDGKTLFLDAIVRLLYRRNLGRARKDFGNLVRVEEDPEGFITLVHEGEEVKIGRSDSLASLAGITPADFRNIFVVRDSDMAMVRTNDYFAEVSEKLAGLKTSQIARVKKSLQAIGRLTSPRSDGELANNSDTEHIRGRVEGARAIVDDIDALRERLEVNGFERLEEQLVAQRRELRVASDALQQWRRRSEHARYAELDEAAVELAGCDDTLRELAEVTDARYEQWRNGERDRDRLGVDLAATDKEIDALRGRSTTQEDRVVAARSAATECGEREQRFHDAVDVPMYRYEALVQTFVEKDATRRAWQWCAGSAALLTAGAVTATVLAPSPLAFVVAGVLFAATALCGARVIQLRRIAGHTARARHELLTIASRIGVHVDEPRDIAAHRSVFERDNAGARRALGEAEVRYRTLKVELDAAGEGAARLRKKIADAEETIATTRIEARAQSLDEFYASLARKRETATRQRLLRENLTTALGRAEDAAQWRDRIQAALGELGEVEAASPVDRDVAALERRVSDLSTAVETSEAALAEGRRSLRDIQRAARECGALDDAVVCRTTGELAALRESLQSYAWRVNERLEDARTALAIVEEIEAEEEARVVELFGADQPVSEYFAKITRGEYREVGFDPESGSVRVRRSSGDWVRADQLSGGTFDQLYLAIRLSLAEGLLGGKPGFFLFDDPFIKSDRARLSGQIDILRQLAEDGWQIMFFSAKKEVLDALRPAITAGEVDLVRLARPSVAAAKVSTTRAPGDPFADDLFSGRPSY